MRAEFAHEQAQTYLRQRNRFAVLAGIDAILQSNDALARSYRLQGTPGIVIGDIIVPGAIDRATLDQVIARAGKQSAQPNQS